MKHVLITGATGFLGRHLTRRLLSAGVPVRILARSVVSAQNLVDRGASLVVGDVTDAAAVRRALEGVSVVYHLAGKLFMPGVPAATYARTHVLGTKTLLAECAGIDRFVHCSTTGVLGVTGSRPAGEAAPPRPTNAYEQTKLEAECLVGQAQQRGLAAAIVRPGLVYGPGDLHLLGFFQAIQRGWFRPIGRRPAWLHPIYIDDLTDAFVVCGNHPAAVGQCFHIAGRQPVSIVALAEAIAMAVGVAPASGFIPLPLAGMAATVADRLPKKLQPRMPLSGSRVDFLTHSRVYDISHAEELLGFCPRVDLVEGIARAAAWYCREGYLRRPAAAR